MNVINAKLGDNVTLTEENRQQIIAKCQVVSEYWTNTVADFEKLQKYENSAFTHEQALEKFRLLDSECTSIFKIPPPKPEVKEEEKPADKEMPAEEGEAKPEETPASAEDVPMDEQPSVSPDDLS